MSLEAILNFVRPATEPGVIALVLGLGVLFAAVFVIRPRLFLPAIIVLAPFPKLFLVGTRYSVELHSRRIESAPGFSLGELVLAGGMLALLFRVSKGPPAPRVDELLRKRLVVWIVLVLLSFGWGRLLRPSQYGSVHGLYALRYAFTLMAYFVARSYLSGSHANLLARRTLAWLFWSGNAVVALGLLYHLAVLKAWDPSLWASPKPFSSETPVFRSLLWFFDYGMDMGFYCTLIGLVNMARLELHGNLTWQKAVALVGVAQCGAAIVFLGGRAGFLVWAVSMIAWLRIRAKRSPGRLQRWVFSLLAVQTLAIVVWMARPAYTLEKLARTRGSLLGAGYATLQEVGAPRVFWTLVEVLPVGDFADRLAYNLASFWFFLRDPWGVGFWGELAVTGWLAHHEVIKVAVELGVIGLVSFFLLLSALWKAVWHQVGREAPWQPYGSVLAALTAGMFAAMVFANTAFLSFKFGLLYWALVGTWSGMRIRSAQGVWTRQGGFLAIRCAQSGEGCEPALYRR